MVHVDIQTSVVVHAKVFLGILEQEGGLAHTAASLDAYQPVVPVDFIHERTLHGSLRVLYEIAVSAKKGVQHTRI